MTPARLVQAPAVPTTEIIDLAFFTIGDNRAAGSPPDLPLTMEQMWRRRAEALAPGHFHGVADLDAAIAVLRALRPDQVIRKVFFLGHGSGDDFGFFFFSGRPDPVESFTSVSDDQVLEMSRADMRSMAMDRNKEFLLELFNRLARSDPRVETVSVLFLACFMGQGETHQAVCDFLSGWLVGARETRFEVGAYTNFYETVFVTDGHGTIVRWEDHIVVTPGGAEVVPSPGPNQIPAFEVGCGGKMVRTPLLFTMSAMMEGDLRSGTMTADLRQEFRLNGTKLSKDVRILADGAGRWRIVDDESGIMYRVVKERGELSVYQP